MSVTVRWRSRSGSGSLWVANSLDSTVSRVDPSTLAVRAVITVGSGPAALAAGPGPVWVANQYSGTVSRIDPGRDRVVSTVAVGGAPTSLTFNGGRLWAGVPAVSGTHRGGTLVIVTPGPLTSSQISGDERPCVLHDREQSAVHRADLGRAVTFQQSTAPAGCGSSPTLLFRSRRRPTAAGPSRSGPSGDPLLRRSAAACRDFRRGVERLFRDGSQGTSVYAGLVGASACMRDPDGCNLSQGIVTNDAGGR